MDSKAVQKCTPPASLLGMHEARFWTWDPAKLRAEMSVLGVTIGDLSVRTGLSKWTLYKVTALQGGRWPTREVADLIVSALGTDSFCSARQDQGVA